MSGAEPTYRHNPPVPQTKGCITQLETQETKHSEELGSGGTENKDDERMLTVPPGMQNCELSTINALTVTVFRTQRGEVNG